MLKTFMSRLAQRKRAKATCQKRAALHARLRLEVLEDRLAPATVQWLDKPTSNNWSDLMNPPWVGGKQPGAFDFPVFARAASSPYLSNAVTVSALIVRSLGGMGAAATYTTNLDMKGQNLTATASLDSHRGELS